MARRSRPIEDDRVVQDGAELERRLRNLLRGASPYLVLEPAHSTYATAKAAHAAIADADNPALPLGERVRGREALLSSMGRLDRALHHCAAMDRRREGWAT